MILLLTSPVPSEQSLSKRSMRRAISWGYEVKWPERVGFWGAGRISSQFGFNVTRTAFGIVRWINICRDKCAIIMIFKLLRAVARNKLIKLSKTPSVKCFGFLSAFWPSENNRFRKADAFVELHRHGKEAWFTYHCGSSGPTPIDWLMSREWYPLAGAVLSSRGGHTLFKYPYGCPPTNREHVFIP